MVLLQLLFEFTRQQEGHFVEVGSELLQQSKGVVSALVVEVRGALVWQFHHQLQDLNEVGEG